MTRAVFVDCTPDLTRVITAEGLPVPNSVTVHERNPGTEELIELCRDARVVFVEHTVVSPAVLDACPSIRAIVFMGTGAGTYVDLEDAARRGVVVRTTPGYGDQAVAEHAFALMFAGARGVAKMDREIRDGLWVPTSGLQLKGRKVAVIGLGGIGRSFANMARGIGMSVAAWNRTPQDCPGFTANLNDALQDADVVSIHLALNAETVGILDPRRLRLPAPGFVLVNTARAALIDEAALLAGLSDGRIGHAALDVFSAEPPVADDPFRTLQNVTLTAHAAYMTDAAYAELWLRTLRAYEDVSAAL